MIGSTSMHADVMAGRETMLVASNPGSPFQILSDSSPKLPDKIQNGEPEFKATMLENGASPGTWSRELTSGQKYRSAELHIQCLVGSTYLYTSRHSEPHCTIKRSFLLS